MKIPRLEEFNFFQNQVPVTHPFPEQFLIESHSSIDRRGQISLTERSVLADMIQGNGFHIFIQGIQDICENSFHFWFSLEKLEFQKRLELSRFYSN
jgi:hypothetical protein